MKVEVKLHAQLRRFAPRKNENLLKIEVEEGTSVRDLLAQIGVPLEKARLIIINGVRSEATDILADGAAVDLFPPLAGG